MEEVLDDHAEKKEAEMDIPEEEGDAERKEAMMSKRKGDHHYHNKVPPFTPDPEHYTRKQHTWKAKVAYETEDAAWEFLNQRPELKAQGYVAYQCKTCQKWHVGN